MVSQVLRSVLAVLLLLTICTSGDAARILGVFHFPSRSHHILGSALLKALSERGHDVTMVSPYPFKNKIKNYRDVFIEEMLQFKEDSMQGIMIHNLTFYQQISKGTGFMENLTKLLLSHEKFQKLKAEAFDLVIQFPIFSDALLGLAHHFGAPVILFSTLGGNDITNKVTGNPAPPSYVPSAMATFQDEMTFLQRVFNTLSTAVLFPAVNLYFDHKQRELLTKHFPNAPSLEDLISNVSLVFLNSHYSIETVRPYLPNMIQVGGLHVEEPKDLPEDLKSFLDGAQNGAVFFSLGSNVKVSEMPQDKVRTIVKVLGKLDMKVLFKSDQAFPGAPENIKFGKWLPQNDILGHPNVKLFISHGGLLSTIETVYHGVPIIGIPIFGDQKFNIANAVSSGYAVQIYLDDVTEETFSDAVRTILTDPKYKETIQLKSTLLRDQPVKPMELAIFWVEHVLKHKGAVHLKNAGTKLAWYQYMLIDVFLFLFVLLSLLLAIVYFTTRKVIFIISNRLFKMTKVKTN